MLLGSVPPPVKFQVKVQFVGPPFALPCESPFTDQLRSAAKPEVVARKLAELMGLAELLSIRTSSVELDAGEVIVRPVTDGPRPPTGLMIEEVCVTLCWVARVDHTSRTLTRL
jgi:hypothetical protein